MPTATAPILRDVPSAAPEGLAGLLRELGDLKRVRSAGAPGSIAERRFRTCWAELTALTNSGAPLRAAVEQLTRETTARHLAAARLADLDAPTLRELGLGPTEVRDTLRAGYDDVLRQARDALPAPAVAAWRDALRIDAVGTQDASFPFVERLARQPRAGVTCPGQPRIILEPAENHAEHCLTVAVYGVLLAPFYGADEGTVFLAGLAHHLHNAAMPDAGFTGEMLLGAQLEPVMARATEAALREVPDALRREIERAREILPDASTPEGRAFHAADVADRVLEIAQHARRAELTMDVVLGEMALVHDGPVKPFHDAVLEAMGLP